MKKKNKNWWFWSILIILFVIYCGFSIALNSGYYESQLNKKTTMTSEQIKKFEKDIKNGENIDINNYLVDNKENYDNNITRASLKISENVEKIMTTGISETLKVLGKMFGD